MTNNKQSFIPTINHSLTREEFKQNLSARGLKMVHQNIRGLDITSMLLKSLLHNTHKEIDLLSLSETHLSSDTLSGSLLLTGIGGGFGIYIRNNISFKQRFNLKNNLLESLCLETFIKNSKSILLASHYCPLDGSKYLVDNYNTMIHDNINKISIDDKETKNYA